MFPIASKSTFTKHKTKLKRWCLPNQWHEPKHEQVTGALWNAMEFCRASLFGFVSHLCVCMLFHPSCIHSRMDSCEVRCDRLKKDKTCAVLPTASTAILKFPMRIKSARFSTVGSVHRDLRVQARRATGRGDSQCCVARRENV